MEINQNTTRYRVYFKYDSIEEFLIKSKTIVHSNSTKSKTITQGLKHIVTATLINFDTKEIVKSGVANCSMFDVYNKRFGMALAVTKLILNLEQVDNSKHELGVAILDKHFSLRKNSPYSKMAFLKLNNA
jgi:hypothetical protein